MPLQPLRITHHVSEQRLVVVGDVENRDVDLLRRMLERLVEDGGGRVDLGRVTFLPSLAIGTLGRCAVRAARDGSPVVLHAPIGTIAQRVLAVVGVEHETREPDEPPPAA